MTHYMICVAWEERGREAAVERSCSRCGRRLALGRANEATVERLQMVTLCVDCMPTVVEDDTQVAGLLAGQIYEDLAVGLLAAAASRNRN